jgi:hypothetical protein
VAAKVALGTVAIARVKATEASKVLLIVFNIYSSPFLKK